MKDLMRRQAIRRGLLAGAVLGSLCVPLFGSARAAETSPNDYQLTAEAQGLQVTLIDTGAPLIQRYDASPYGASAELTSLGTSTADAGAPYSPVVAALPGTISGLGGATGQFPPVPPLPGYVYSSYPVRETDQETQGAYTVSATSAEGRSEGFVSLGSSAPGDASTLFSAATVVSNPDGSVTTSGRSGIDRISLGGVLDIANISSLASITKNAGRPSAYTTTTNLGAVTLDSAKLDLAGQAQQQQLTPALISGLNTVLAPAGITLTYLPARYVFADGSTASAPVSDKGIQSVDSAALQVEMAQEVEGQGKMLVRMTLGRVFVGATNDPTGVVGPSLGDAVGGAPGGAAAPVVDSAAGVLPGTSVGAVPGSPPLVATGNTTATGFVGQLSLGPSGETLYLVLALAALVALGCARSMKEKS